MIHLIPALPLVSDNQFTALVEDPNRLGRATLFAIDLVGQNVDIEVAVAVEISKGGNDRAVLEINAIFSRSLFELQRAVRSLPILDQQVDEELIGIVVIADVNVEISVIVDIGEGDSDGPGLLATADTGGFGHVLEFQARPLQIETIFERPISGKHVRHPVQIQITYGHCPTG